RRRGGCARAPLAGLSCEIPGRRDQEVGRPDQGQRDLVLIERLSREEPMTLFVKNLDAPLGAEVSGVDLARPVSPDDIAAIEHAWRERLGGGVCDPRPARPPPGALFRKST